MRKALFLLFLVFMCLVLSFSALAVDISAKSAVLIEMQSKDTVFEKSCDTVLPMASTTKIMTAIVVIESCPLDKIVTIEPCMTGVEGSSIYLKVGEQLTVKELLYALMLESANDAATALAYTVGGSIEGFASMMNAKAQSLGLKNTNFENPHGLDSENHYTTARDLGLLACYAMKNKEFADIVSTRKITIPLNNGEGTRVLVNHNRLLRTYDGAIGIKTGYTKRCGRCLVSSAVRDGVELVCVTLNAPNDWLDHQKMLDYGFEQYVNLKLADAGDYVIELNAVNGQKGTFKATNSQNLSVTLKRSNVDISAVFELNRLICAPIHKGDLVGNIVFYNNGIEIGKLPIVSLETVKNKEYKKSFFERIFG